MLGGGREGFWEGRKRNSADPCFILSVSLIRENVSNGFVIIILRMKAMQTKRVRERQRQRERQRERERKSEREDVSNNEERKREIKI